MNSPILAPAAVLILWSLTVMMWMIVTRFPAFKKADIDLANGPAGARYQDVESALPEKVNWKSHNYTHLMEQPTLFYAVVAVLALAGAGSGLNLQLAWAYVGLRIVHSLWQILVNTVPVRVVLFAISSTCLIVMAVNAVRVTVLG
ncbi:MAG: MAPEG family protein [Pseudomonadales bacterium]